MYRAHELETRILISLIRMCTRACTYMYIYMYSPRCICMYVYICIHVTHMHTKY